MNEIIKELFGGNNVLIGVFLIFLYLAHKEAMAEIRKLNTTINHLATTLTLQGSELGFVKDAAKENKKEIKVIAKDLHSLKNNVITKEQMDTITDKL